MLWVEPKTTRQKVMGLAPVSPAIREIMAQGRHKSVMVLPKYVKRSTDQVAAGAQKRRVSRETKAET
jgi:hypothetical protein